MNIVIYWLFVGTFFSLILLTLISMVDWLIEAFSLCDPLTVMKMLDEKKKREGS